MPFESGLDKLGTNEEIVLMPEQKVFCEEYRLPEYELQLRHTILYFFQLHLRQPARCAISGIIKNPGGRTGVPKTQTPWKVLHCQDNYHRT